MSKRRFVFFLVAVTLAVPNTDRALAQDASSLCDEDVSCARRNLEFLADQNKLIFEEKERLARTPGTRASNTATSDQLDNKLSFNEQTQVSLRDWFAANAAIETVRDKVAATDKRIETLRAINSDVTDRTAFDRLIKAEEGARDALNVSVGPLLTARRSKWDDFMLRRKVAGALSLAHTPGVEGGDKRNAAYPLAKECLLETAVARANFDPNYCQNLRNAALTLSPASSASAVNIAGRPLERRGVFTSVTGSKDGTSLSLGIADEFKFRRYTPGSEKSFKQRLMTIGWSGSVKSDGGDLFSFAPEKDGESLGALDRLNAKTSFTGTISLNLFPREDAPTFTARGAAVYAGARNACLEEQSKTTAPSSCEGPSLVAWMMASDSTGGYGHPVHAAALSNLYFGSPKSMLELAPA